jgi:hypothetical protein
MISVNVSLRYCPHCKQNFSVRRFYKKSSGWYQSYCIPCFKARSKRDGNGYYQRHRTERLAQSRVRRWKDQGATPDMVDQALKEQEGRCAICRDPFELSPARVDHDHLRDKFRGLLCHSCNTGLGLFRDSPCNLVRAITYLIKHGAAYND